MAEIDKLVAAFEEISSKENSPPAVVFKAFNELIRTKGQTLSDNIALVLEKFVPSTRIGRIIKIRLADSYRVHSEILKLLQSCDSLNTSQALKCRWFFAELEDSSYFVEQILPSLSYSVRRKVINRYASCLKITATGEAFYLSLKSRYGVNDAMLMLPACSESFIRGELPNLKGVLFRPNLIEAIQEKYPSLATEYLTYLVDKESPHNGKDKYITYVDYRPLFERLSRLDLQAFMDLYEKHRSNMPYLTLSRRALKKAINNHFDYVLTHHDFCHNYLGCEKFYKRLSLEKMKGLYTKCLLPPTLTEFFEISKYDQPVYCVLQDHVKPNRQNDFFQEAFQSKYGRLPFSSKYISKFDNRWMKFAPIQTKIESAEKVLTGDHHPREQAEVIAHLPVDRSIPALKKLIEAQHDTDVRSSIATQMIKTLRHNNYHEGFKDVMSYLNKRFRNETKHFRGQIMHTMDNNGEFILQLTKDDWVAVEELIDIIRLNNEVNDLYWSVSNILGLQIHCYLLREVDSVEIEGLLEKLFELHMTRDYFDYGPWLSSDTPYHRLCLEWFIKRVPSESSTKKTNLYKVDAISTILAMVIEINKKNKSNPVVLPEEFIKMVEELLRDADVQKDCDVTCLIKRAKCIPALGDRVIRATFPLHKKGFVLTRLLKIDPDLVHGKLDELFPPAFECSWRGMKPFYAKCRLYESYGIPQKLERICRTSFKHEKNDDLKGGHGEGATVSPPGLPTQLHAVQTLSIILQPSEYADLISPFTPTQKRIENLQENIELFALQKTICRTLPFVSEPYQMLTPLWKFTGGDYLKIAVGALNGVCSRVSEKDVLPVLNKWTDCPISLRKHILRLIRRLAPVEESTKAFIEFFKNEKNSSLRRLILLEVRRTFIFNPSDENYCALSSLIDLVTKEDEVLKDLIFVESMSSEYVSRYLELLWDKISSDWQQALPHGKTKVIDIIDKRFIRSIEEKFCTKLLLHALGKLPEPLPDFVYLSVLEAPSWDVQESLLREVLAALAPHVRDLDKRETEPGYVFKIRNTLSRFVDNLCERSRESEGPNGARVLTEVKTALGSMPELQRSLRLFFWLDAHILYHKVRHDTKTSFESELVGLYKKYIMEYEAVVPHSLVAILANIVPMVSSPTKFAHELLQVSELPLCQVLAVKIAQRTIESDKELPFFTAIVETLLNSSHPDVQTAAAEYFEELSSSLIV